MTEREIFEGALDHSEPAQHRAYLDRACGGNAALRARIEALLQSHESASEFFERPGWGATHPGGLPHCPHGGQWTSTRERR